MQKLKGSKLAQLVGDTEIVWTRIDAAPSDGFTPNEAMRAEAERGLAWRAEFNRGGTEVGVARARDISNGRSLSRDTVMRMVSYFARHEVDKQGEGWDRGEDGYPSAGRIAWALWGGDPGRTWANAIAERIGASLSDWLKTQVQDGEGAEEPYVQVEEQSASSGLPTFSMTAYNGGPMNVSGWDAPVAVDLAGLQWTAKSRPILKDHAPSMPIGHTTRIAVVQNQLQIEGVISGAGRVAREIVESSRNGFPWQASIGADAGRIEFTPEGEETTVNGRVISGPVYVSRRAVLGEVSFVALGADDSTEAKVAATFAADSREHEMQKKEDSGEIGINTDEVVAKVRAAAAAESSRIASIRERTAGNDSIAATAIAEGWDADRAELEVLRAARANAVPAAIVKTQTVTNNVLEAAVAISAKMPRVDSHYDSKTLEAADGMRNIGLQELVLTAAAQNGYTGRSLRGDTRGVLQAAFSTMSLPGIFSNIANKFLVAGFTQVDQAWRSIASTRSVSDFKALTSYRLNGGFMFEQLGPGGEIKHGKVSEESPYTNQAKTYAKMFAVTREDLINDDLGALSAVPQRIGRGAALKLNEVFWSTFLANSGFFTAGNGNVVTSNGFGTGIESLTKAEQKFMDQTDSDGFPIAIAPATLLVPTALYTPAVNAMRSTEVRGMTGKDVVTNPHAGKFTVVTTPYLSSAAIPNNSASSWYLLADPGTMSTIEVCFLNGTESPTIEQAEADFSTLGIQMRGFFDFGVALQEHRAGVKSTA